MVFYREERTNWLVWLAQGDLLTKINFLIIGGFFKIQLMHHTKTKYFKSNLQKIPNMQDYDQPIVPKPPKKPSNSADQQQTQPSFFFPNFIYRGLKFKSPEEIRKKTYINDSKHKSIWKFRYRPRKSNCEYFTVVCKFCDANFNTKRKQDGYVVISVKLKHNHRPPAHYQFFEKISNILIQGELEENSEKQQIFRSEESLQQQNPQNPKHPNLQQQLPQLPQLSSIQSSSSSSLKQPQFIFPATIKVNDTFDCFEDIIKKIQYEEKTIGENFKSGWWYRFRPRKLDYTYLMVICRQCDAHFCLTRKRGAFLTVSNVRLKHNHQLKGYKQGVECKEARVFDFLKERYKSLNISGKKLKKQLQKQIKIDDANFNKIKSQFLKLQANKWPYLQNFLSQTKSRSLSDWLSLNPQTQRYPPIIVIVSPSMSQTYQKFGDLLIFDILQNMLIPFSQDCSYRKIGIFSVIDTNLRPLIAGIAIFQHQNDLLKTFKMFLEIHQKTPETIMTDDNPAINAAMAELKAIYVTSLGHVLNPRLVIGRVGKALKGEVKEVEKSLRVLSEVMESRTLEGYERKLMELVKDEGVGEQIESILAIKEKIFYMEMPRTFVGINLTTMEGVCDMIRQSIQPKSTIIELTKQLHNLSQRLYLHLKKKNCQSYHDPIQRSLEDWRVRHVRLSFQRKPFTHFLSNYIKGLKTLILNDTSNPNPYPNTLQLLNLTTGESFDIVDWTCECGQQEKTGIPCPHLIMAAKTVPDKSYRELFYRRWKKGVVRQRDRWAIMGRPRETMKRRSRGWNKGVTQDGRGADDEGDQ